MATTAPTNTTPSTVVSGVQSLTGSLQKSSQLKNITDITHAFYINLLARTDRKEHVEQQLTTIGITNATRFDAIKLPSGNGALGCSFSHLKCLQIAKQQNWDHVLVCEDDILFQNPTLFVTQLNKFLLTHDDWDVILIAGNNMPPYKPIDDTCVQVTRCQTTTGYIVNSRYFDTLIDNFRQGVSNLMREPQKHVLYAIDKYWFRLQEKDKWFIIIPLSVVQREDYSDIEHRTTNYTRIMVDLDKRAWFPQHK